MPVTGLQRWRAHTRDQPSFGLPCERLINNLSNRWKYVVDVHKIRPD
jgi:hypothetical protein